MADQSTPITNWQAPASAAQPPKKTIFGGEVNFNDPNNFEFPVQSNEEPLTFEPQLPADPPQSKPVATEEFADFDPFGDGENTEEIPMVHASNNTQQETTSTETTSETEGTPVSGNEKIIPVSTQEPYEEEISLDFSDENNEDENKSEIPNAEPALPPVSEEEDALETTPIPKTGNTLFDKFLSLTDTARAIFALSEDKSSFKIIGNKTETTLIEYFVYLIEDEIDHLDLFIKKVETQGDEEDEHLLQWSYDTAKQRLDILVDEMLLYQFNQKNTEANGVFDKLNKFWFLFETHLTELEKLVQEKQEAESKKKQLHEIFRNF